MTVERHVSSLDSPSRAFYRRSTLRVAGLPVARLSESSRVELGRVDPRRVRP